MALLALLALSPGGRPAVGAEIGGAPVARVAADGDFLHRVWLPEHGLPQSTVMAVAESTDGYLWVGTQHGLARFDGVDFTLYNRLNRPALRSDFIRFLVPDPGGAIWAGTSGDGVARLSPQGDQAFGRAEGLSSDAVTALWVDTDGSAWVGTARDGLNRIAGGSIRQYRRTDGLVTDGVRSLLRDAAGTLWIGCDQGLNALDREGVLRAWPQFPRGSERSVTCLRLLADGRIAAVVGGTAVAWAGSPDEAKPLAPEGSQLGHVQVVHPAGADDLWLGTQTGLVRLFRGTVRSLGPMQGMSGDVVGDIGSDRGGNVWVGTLGSGLHRFKPQRLRRLTPAEGLPTGFVFSVAEDATGEVWIGTYGAGLVRLRETAGRPEIRTVPEVAHTVVRAVATAADGSVWAGTYGAGVYRLQGGSVANFTTREGLPGNEVYALLGSDDGRVVVGTTGGLAVFADGRFSPVAIEGEAASASVRAICPGAESALWLGTHGAGLLQWTGGRLEPFRTVPDRNILALAAGPGGGLWIGTSGGGLLFWREGRLRRWTDREGLPDNVIYQIQTDRSGHLWLGTGRGVCEIAVDALLQEPAPRGGWHPRVFDSEDGLPGAECNGGNQPSGMIDGRGRLWFPTTRGLGIIDPAEVEAVPAAPRPVVERLVADGVEFPVGAKAPLRIPAGTRRFEFKYTGLVPGSPERARFQVWLEGADEGWQDVGTRRTAYYQNLAPGDYTFRVRASVPQSAWSDATPALGFVLQPRLQQTLAFRVLLVAAGVLAALGAHRARTAQMGRRQAELSRLVEERTRRLRERTEELERAAAEVKTLRGLLPICSHCKKIRDEAGSWHPIEVYITRRSEAQFTHGICPVCLRQHYPDIAEQVLAAAGRDPKTPSG